MILSKEQLLQPMALPTEDIDLPQFGGTIRVRAWTGADYDTFGKAVKEFSFDGSMYAAALAASAINESGDRLFDMNGDIQRIASTFLKTTLERTYDVIRRMNKLGKEGLEDAEKN